MDMQEDKDRELNSKVLSKKGKEKGILKKWILSTLVFLFSFFSFFLYFSLYFLLNNWNELTIDEILYHLKAPMGGANGDLVRLFLLSVLLPSSVIVLLLFCFYILLQKCKLQEPCSVSSPKEVPAGALPAVKKNPLCALHEKLISKKKTIFFKILVTLKHC